MSMQEASSRYPHRTVRYLLFYKMLLVEQHCCSKFSSLQRLLDQTIIKKLTKKRLIHMNRISILRQNVSLILLVSFVFCNFFFLF